MEPITVRVPEKTSMSIFINRIERNSHPLPSDTLHGKSKSIEEMAKLVSWICQEILLSPEKMVATSTRELSFL
jgi:hypothetical protein